MWRPWTRFWPLIRMCWSKAKRRCNSTPASALPTACTPAPWRSMAALATASPRPSAAGASQPARPHGSASTPRSWPLPPKVLPPRPWPCCASTCANIPATPCPYRSRSGFTGCSRSAASSITTPGNETCWPPWHRTSTRIGGSTPASVGHMSRPANPCAASTSWSVRWPPGHATPTRPTGASTATTNRASPRPATPFSPAGCRATTAAACCTAIFAGTAPSSPCSLASRRAPCGSTKKASAPRSPSHCPCSR